MRLRPGWYLLLGISVYASVVTLAWRDTLGQLDYAQNRRLVLEQTLEQGLMGFTLPIPGACLPSETGALPGAPRSYRSGVSFGFVFSQGDACVPIIYGEGVVADAGGTIVKADINYIKPSPEAFAKLIETVKNGANAQQMNQLRGREIWIDHSNGYISVYGHLSGIAPGIRVGVRVRRGQWIGYLGNSGTSSGVDGSKAAARLLLEVWRGGVGHGHYLGEGQPPQAALSEARKLFNAGP